MYAAHTHTQSDHSIFDKSGKLTEEMTDKHQLEIIDVNLIVLPPSSPISVLAAMTAVLEESNNFSTFLFFFKGKCLAFWLFTAGC